MGGLILGAGVLLAEHGEHGELLWRITMQIELVYDKMDVLLMMVMSGVTLGVLLMVVVAFMRIGWKLAPYILVVAMIIYLMNGV
jgi:hypothetical protein